MERDSNLPSSAKKAIEARQSARHETEKNPYRNRDQSGESELKLGMQSNRDDESLLKLHENGKFRLWSTKSIFFQCVACLPLLFGLFLLYWSQKYYSEIRHLIFSFFGLLNKVPEPIRSLLSWSTSLVIQVMSIPIASLVMMVISYSYSDYFYGYLLCFSSCIIANLIMLKMMRQRQASQTGQGQGPDLDVGFLEFLVHTIESTVHGHPYVACCIVRTLHMPDYAKVYILTRFALSLPQLLIPMVFIESLNVFLYTLVGFQMQSKFDMINPKSFESKSLPEKLIAIMILALLATQIVIVISGMVYTSLKFRQFKESEEGKSLEEDVKENELK